MTERQKSESDSHTWTNEDDLRLIHEYIRVGVPVDHLAYTEHFEKLYSGLVDKAEVPSRKDVFRRLLNLRKRGKIPRLFKQSEE